MIKFALIAEPRSGTHFFTSALEPHPEINPVSEIMPGTEEEFQFHHYWLSKIEEDRDNILLPRFPLLFWSFLDYLEEISPAGTKCLGVDIKCYQAEWRPEIYAVLQRKEFKVIHLIRENLLARSASMALHEPEIREKHQRSHHHSKTGKQPKLHLLSGEELLTEFDRQEQDIDRHRLGLSNEFEYLELTFEQLVDPGKNGIRDAELDRIYDFLGIENRLYDLSTTLRKLNPELRRHMISNYCDVVETLAGTKYEWMLDSPEKDIERVPAYRAIQAGEGSIQEGDMGQAAENFVAAIEMAPDLADPVFLLGMVHVVSGDFDEGVELIARGLAMTKDTSEHPYFTNFLQTIDMDKRTRKLFDAMLRSN